MVASSPDIAHKLVDVCREATPPSAIARTDYESERIMENDDDLPQSHIVTALRLITTVGAELG